MVRPDYRAVDHVGGRVALHTYICLRLIEGADIYQVAKNCRTSVEMIEKYYGRHLKNNIDASAVDVRKARPKPIAARKKAIKPTA